MKRYVYILCLCSLFLVLGSTLKAQDVQRFSERPIIGTARYVGMGGAMTAIGADPSAVQDNPAGLGLYRRAEIMLTLDGMIDRTCQKESNEVYKQARFALPQVSAVWAWGNPNKQRGMIYNNFMFSIQRLANYNRDVVVAGSGMGMAQTIGEKTNGLAEEFLIDTPWDDEEIGWLSILGYEGFLIDPIENNRWIPAVDFNAGTLSVSETGSVDQYTLSWASNISNQWYMGLSLNIPTITYTKHISLLETNRFNSAELKSMYYASGLGVNGTIGLIYRPIQALRIGASFQTPSVMHLSVQTEGDMYSTINGQNYEILTPSSGSINTTLASPLRTSMSVAGQIGNAALIAVQYDYAHSAEMEDVHTLRIGAEAQAYRGLFINAGYVYESSFMNEELAIGLDYNSIRTDMDYRYTASSQYASLGIGYRSNVLVAQVAYQYRWQTLHQYATEMQLTPIDVQTRTHRFVATLAWRF